MKDQLIGDRVHFFSMRSSEEDSINQRYEVMLKSLNNMTCSMYHPYTVPSIFYSINYIRIAVFFYI